MPAQYYVENTQKYADKQFHCHGQDLEAGVGITQHMHEWVEILFCTQGTHTVYLRNTALPFNAGSLVVIPINEIHRIENDGDETGHYLVIKFASELLLSIVDEEEYDIIRPFMLMSSPQDYLFTPEMMEGNIIPNVIHSMIREYADKKYGYRLELRAYVYMLTTFLVRSWHERGIGVDHQPSATVHTKRIFECLNYIQKNYTQQITLAMLAERCHVSYCYFSRQFTEVTGTSFAGYLTNIRINAAEHLLVTTDTPITDVALQVGFSDASYFTRRFTMKNSITPNLYRQRFSTLRGGTHSMPEDE